MKKLCWMLFCLIPTVAAAQGDFPHKPVRLVVPFPPGGATDVVARLLGAKLSEGLKQQVIIENRPGAGATLATEQIAKAAPDGYTLLMTAFPSITTAPLINPNVRYDPVRDFTHVAMIGTFPNGFVVRADSQIHSIADFIAWAKAHPGKASYGSAGPASSGHLTGELLKQLGGIDIVHIPYKGAAPAFLDLLGGQLVAVFDGMINATNQAKAGKIRLLAVTSEQRLPTHPDLPTMNETVRGVFGVSWFGVAAPARLPAPIQERLENEVVRALATPEVKTRLGDTGMTITALRSSEFVSFIQADIRKWSPIVKAAKLRHGQ